MTYSPNMTGFQQPQFDNAMSCVICGVGGQGNVLASRLIAYVLMERGEHVKTAETIGMAQKGGSVVSHVRGGRPQSPLVPAGMADCLLAFEPAEAARCLSYVKPGGTVVVNTNPVQPTTAALADSLRKKSERGQNTYDGSKALAYLRSIEDIKLIEVDGLKLAKQAGSAKALNVVLLAAATKSGALGITREELETAIKALVKERFHAMNLQAVAEVFGA